MIYLFLGQDLSFKDSPFSSKDIQFKQIKEEFLPKEVEQFNLDILYAETLKLKELQEKLLALPVRSPKRIIMIRNAQELPSDIEDFIASWAKCERKDIVLLLDIEEQGKKEAFLRRINKYAKVFRFKESHAPNTFNLTRSIEQRKPDYALKLLEQLLKDGERPERILGGLRYTLENSPLNAFDIKRRIKMLLECDVEIKTGKAKPVFALEKLIVRLCALAQPFH
jgi:DNA polymerase III delta subunit